jgi:integrase
VDRVCVEQAIHIEALLRAATELDSEGACRPADPRCAVLATLMFAGLRIGERCPCAGETSTSPRDGSVSRSKTDAGVREVALLPVLREELSALKARLDPQPHALVFGSSRGAPQNPTNVRQRILLRTVKRANGSLAAGNHSPLPEGLTLHRSVAPTPPSCSPSDAPPPEVMERLGHADAPCAADLCTRDERRCRRAWDAERSR